MRALPSFRQLRFLAAVVELRHFSRAAAACAVSQSTLSSGIRELEELLGVLLLERTKRSVTPTPIGRELAARAGALLEAGENFLDIAQTARDPMSGPLDVGVIPTIGPFLLPQAMPSLRRAFPRLKLYLREERTATLLERLDMGELDLVILALPWAAEGVEAIEIGRDPFWVVVPKDHALASADRVRPDQMASESLLLLEDGHCLRDHALAACSLEGALRNIAFQGTSLHTLVQMAANGLGVTLVPQMALASGLLRGTDLVARPLDGPRPWRSIGLCWRRSSGRKETFRRLAAVLAEAASAQSDEPTPLLCAGADSIKPPQA